VLFGLTSYVAGFSASFFQHGSESLFLLWTFYFLFCDSQNPGWRVRALAGCTAAMMMLVRVSTLATLPALGLYLLWNIWKRTSKDPASPTREAIREIAAFTIPAAAGILAMAIVNYAKFGIFSVSGSYGRLVPLNNPLFVGLYGFLFSVGDSIFLFTPLLFLMPWYCAGFVRRYRAESFAVAGMALSSLLFYSKAYLWHGQWAFGPRYLAHIVPLLLLPLGLWLQTAKPLAWIAVGAAGAAGVFIELLHWLVNVSFVYYHEGYQNFVPEYGFLFLPESSQIASHWRAIQAWDNRVDFWLLAVYRVFGTDRLLSIAVPLLLLLVLCAFLVKRQYRSAAAASEKGIPPSFARGVPDVVYAIALAWLTLIVLVLVVH
jgi:hypothetical protein